MDEVGVLEVGTDALWVAATLPPPPANPLALFLPIGGGVLVGAFIGSVMLLLITMLKVA